MGIRFIILLAMAVTAGVLSFFFLPAYADDLERALGRHIGMGFAVAISILQLSALWYFLASLKTFKTDLRKAYYWLAAGLFIFSLGQLQLPFAFLIAELPFAVAALLVLVPFLLGPLVMFLGVRRFARLLQVRSLWTRISVAIGVALLGSTIPALMALAVFQNIDTQPAIIQGFVTWGGGFALVSSLLALRIRNSLSPAYRSAMTRMSVVMAALAVACVHEVFARSILGAFDATLWYTQLNLSVWTFLVVAVLMLWAALSFWAVTSQYAALAEDASELDTVIHTALLVSVPTEIDAVMDKVRVITASRPSSEFTTTDKKSLVEVYLQLEDYLVNKERLRKFSRDDLRSTLPPRFQKLLG